MVMLATIATLPSGCARVTAQVNLDRMLSVKPDRLSWMYTEVRARCDEGAQVLVFGIQGRHEGLLKTDYNTLVTPLFLLPGYYRVSFACPGASVHAYDSAATIRVPWKKTSCLSCDEKMQLTIAPVDDQRR